MWGEANPEEVRQTWAEKLAAFEGADIKHALDACQYEAPEFPPTLFRFVELCRIGRSKRVGETFKLAPPDPRGGDIAPEVAEVIGQFVETATREKRDPLRWAHRIIEREAAGEKVSLYALNSALEALGLMPTEVQAAA